METRAQYRVIVQQALSEYHATTQTADARIERQLIFDEQHDHYLLMAVGWQGSQRIAHCLIHCDIKANQVWIQHDSTEPGIALELVALGIPKADIVLAFLAPYKRPYTGFGVERAA